MVLYRNHFTVLIVIATLTAFGFYLPTGVQSRQPVQIEEVELIPAGESQLSGGIRFEKGRTLGNMNNTPLEYDNTRINLIDYRMGILDNFEVRLGVTHSDNTPGAANAPRGSGIEGIELGGKIQWHPNISSSLTAQFNGSQDVYPYGSDNPSFSLNVPIKFDLGDGVFHGEAGITLQSGNAMFPGSRQLAWKDYGNIGMGYTYDVNRFTDMSLEVVGHSATVESVTTAGGTTAGGTGATGPSPLDIEDSLELVFGTNIRLARGMRVQPSVGFALMDGSPNFSFGINYEIDFGGRNFPEPQTGPTMEERFSGRNPVGGMSEDPTDDETTETDMVDEPSQQSRLNNLLEKGYRTAQNGNLKKAIQHYKEAKMIAPENLLVLSNLGSLYYRQGDYRRAINNYREAIQVDPRDTFSLLYLGASHYQLGNEQAARQYFNRVLEIDPDNDDANDWLDEMD
jgi:hypothetical protein